MKIEDHLRHLDREGYSPMTVNYRRRALALWKACRFSIARLRRRLSSSPHVARNQVIAVRQYLRWAGRPHEIPLPPVPIVPPLRPPSPDEVRGFLLSTSSLRNRAIVELVYSAGLRACEVTRLLLSDLDLDRGLVRVRGKGGRERTAPVGTAAVAWLVRYLAEGRPRLAPTCEAVFVTRFGKPFGTQGVSMLVRRMARRAGVPVPAHALRRAAAAHCQSEGMNLREIQEFLGHAKLETTVRYTGFDLTEPRKVLERCHPRTRMHLGRDRATLYSDESRERPGVV